ncbi:MAG: HlyD family efflux transporter periplasmic adaptor subunit [Chlamydiota bacterium]|nr:HlyD family efflux transporter periplasmic adaptor subunit [Chlamydiota bacterium]
MNKDTSKSYSETQQMAKMLFATNRLNLKAHKCQTFESLTFLILNDTINVARYDRALLWDLTAEKPKLLGVSGQSNLPKNHDLIKKWRNVVTDLGEPNKPQIFIIDRSDETKIAKDSNEKPKSTVLWLPIFSNEKLTLGMWMELWGDHKNNPPPDDLLGLLVHLLMPSFGLAWEKLSMKNSWKKIPRKTPFYAALGVAVFLMLLFIQVPLRIVAPCEVVAMDPMVIRAPMEGIIKEINVKPGEMIVEGDILFEYDKRVPLQQLKAAQKEVEVLESKLNRAISLSLEEDQSSADNYSILTRQLEKGKIELELVQHHASLLTNKAEQSGMVIIDDPDQLRGKPVQIGERILAINDPNKTKLKIWLPENDNVELNLDEPIKIILNVSSNESFQAKITYISSESTLSEKNIPSFIAEAEWVTHDQNVKLGLKGTAILYGEKVPLWYFFLRKPIAFIRYYVGL